MSNQLDDIEAELTSFADKIREEFVPVVHDGASLIERFSTSKIVQEIGQLLAPLDPEAEEAVVTLIRSLGDAAAKIKALTAPPPPADNPEPPAQP